MNRHKGDTAWLFGKGPSMDKYLESADYDNPESGKVRIVINEAALLVKKPNYFFAHDVGPMNRVFNPERHVFKPELTIDQRVARKFPPGLITIIPETHYQVANTAKVWLDTVFCYQRANNEEKLLKLGPEKLAETHSLYSQSSTPQSAVHFARLIGCVGIVLVGFDGGGGLANVFEAMKCAHVAAACAENQRNLLNTLRSLEMPYRIWGV